MPLEKGSSREVIARNIKKEESLGKPAKQAVAISLSEAGASRKKKPLKRGKDGRFLKRK